MTIFRLSALPRLVAGAALLLSAATASAQVEAIDPDKAIDGDLVTSAPAASTAQPAPAATQLPPVTPAAPASDPGAPAVASVPAASGTAPAQPGQTYRKDDLIGAAEGVFGKGAKGLAEMIEDLLKKQGEPNGYIVGREAGGAFIFGVRYGSGTMVHKVEGQRPVYWTGPSLGIDAGGDATKTFVLVYNLYDSQDLYERFAQVEGRAYFIGGLSATYMRRGDVVVIPIRMGVGMRLGANIGYMKFSEKAKWLPF